jgi:RNA polymerase sigma-B factor
MHYAQRCPEPLEDLQQVGMIGLIRAAERYRPSQGTPFAAFARPHIRGAILHHLRDVAPRVRLPRRQAERLERLLRQEADGAGAMVVAEEERALLLRQRQLCRAIPLEGALLEQLPAREWHDGEEEVEQPARGSRTVRGLLEGLEPRQRRVVAQVVLAGWSYRQLARELEVSPMTVRRLLQQGLDALRSQMVEAEITPPGCLRPAPSASPGC